jgi:DNA-binding NarL/FixJ family response regulator
MIRVLIKAMTPPAGAGLRSLLRSYPSLEVIGVEAGQQDISNDSFSGSPPDVIVAQIDGDPDIQKLLDQAPEGTPVVVLGSAMESSRLFRRGIRGALPGDASGERIAAAIQAAAAGLAVFDASELDGVLEPGIMPETAERLLEPLTDREIEVLRLLAEGLSNKEIAARMEISEHTVKFHVASIMGKLGANNRTEAVISGIRHGIVLI